MPRSEFYKIIKALKILYNDEDGNYAAFFDKAAMRARRRWSTDIESIRAMLRITRPEAIVIGKTMHDIGAGKFINGRRGAETRIEWYFRLDSIGQVARGDHQNLVEIGDNEIQADADPNNEWLQESDTNPGLELENSDISIGDHSGQRAKIVRTRLTHTFCLRHDWTITLDLPSDLTETEGDRLADFVKSLSFERL